MTQPAPAERASFRRALNRPVVTLLALQLMSGMQLSPHATFFPLYVQDLGHSAVLIAGLATAKRAAGLTASLVGGTLSDSLGRKRTLLLGNLGYLISSFAFLAVSSNWIGLLWAIGGFGIGLHTLGAQSYLMDTASPDHLGLLSALYNWGYTLGGALSSPLIGLLLDRGDYGLFAGSLIVFSLCTMAVNQFVLPRSPVERKASAPNLTHLMGYGDIATRPTILVLSALRLLPTLYYATMFLIPLLLDAAGASKTAIAWYATVSWVTASLAQVAVGRAADRWGPKLSTAITFAVVLISAFGMGLWPTSLWAVLVFGTMGTASTWSLSTLLPSLVAEATIPEERGRVLGFIHLWWNAAMIVGSMAGGALFEIASGLPFLVTGAINVFSIALLLVFYRLVARPDAAAA